MDQTLETHFGSGAKAEVAQPRGQLATKVSGNWTRSDCLAVGKLAVQLHQTQRCLRSRALKSDMFFKPYKLLQVRSGLPHPGVGYPKPVSFPLNHALRFSRFDPSNSASAIPILLPRIGSPLQVCPLTTHICEGKVGSRRLMSLRFHFWGFPGKDRNYMVVGKHFAFLLIVV